MSLKKKPLKAIETSNLWHINKFFFYINLPIPINEIRIHPKIFTNPI